MTPTRIVRFAIATALVASLPILSATASADPAARHRVRDRVEDVFDRRENRFDRRENRWDRREDVRDAWNVGGRRDRREDVRDRREDVRDRRENRFDRRENRRDRRH